jgi:hypothetical protein
VQREEVSGYIPLHRAILHEEGTDAIRKMIIKNPYYLSMPTTMELRKVAYRSISDLMAQVATVHWQRTSSICMRLIKRHTCLCVDQDPISGLNPFMVSVIYTLLLIQPDVLNNHAKIFLLKLLIMST